MAEVERNQQGDPSKVTIATQGDSVASDGSYIKGNPNNFAALGNEEDVMAMMRARGWSEAALAALKSGKSVMRNKATLDNGGEIILGEQWDGKQEGEGH